LSDNANNYDPRSETSPALAPQSMMPDIRIGPLADGQRTLPARANSPSPTSPAAR